ncbi:MAG TPA: hypothetical protein VFM68_03445 [Candidatus Saccharimonadales bacterium]|nr:hypothetical protein [Candidatus Saccharimonadales bacterium]
MGLFIRQDDNRSELQRRLTAELTEKAKKKRELDNKPLPDGVKDSTFINDTQATGKFAWLWILLIALAIVAVIVFIFVTS